MVQEKVKLRPCGSQSPDWVTKLLQNGHSGKATKAINGTSESNARGKESMTLMTLDEFGDLCAWLDGPDACDFHRESHDSGLVIWTNGREDFSYTIRWLNSHDIDVPDNIAYLKKHGMHCDADAACLDFRGRKLQLGGSKLRDKINP